MMLSNLATHALATFDETRHLTGEDILFAKEYAKGIIKWSKTIQTRDRIQCVSLLKLQNKAICPYSSLKTLYKSYPMLTSVWVLGLVTSRFMTSEGQKPHMLLIHMSLYKTSRDMELDH